MKNYIKNLLSNKTFIYTSATAIVVIAALLVFAGVNLISGKLTEKFDLKYDFTKSKQYSLSKQTIDFLNRVKVDVKIIMFSNKTPKEIKLTLDKYNNVSPKVKFEYFDSDKQPGLAAKYKLQEGEYNDYTVVVESGKNHKVLNMSEFATASEAPGKYNYLLEQKITGAISYVTDATNTVGYFLQGHEERPIDTLQPLKYILDNLNYKSEILDLFKTAEVPKEASFVAIIGPKRDLNNEEKVKLDNYLKNGGKLFAMFDFNVDLPVFNELLKDYNVKLTNDLILEEDSNRMVGGPNVFIPEVQASNITQVLLDKRLNTVFANARSLGVLSAEQKNVTVTPLFKSSSDSWGETNYMDPQNIKKDDSDLKGPLTIATIVEKLNDNNKTRLAIFGTSKFIDLAAMYPSMGNTDILSESFKWMLDKKETLIIPEKVIDIQNYVITLNTVYWIIAFVGLIPLALIMFGIVVWARRRNA